ncbi:methyltransferase domain-containing protein [Desulfobotulus sp. H1]|uniref:Methyltransferase domain-containing protein n=1 Tax=Desulfobotulus pelophilus TaxID=2823377 RepID=A0ABT3N7I1_9BACT|nr:methyltransferase domain-containing protein [Desulfobotulus pelophilus]MCW7753412.1 methyltransferase domain-containing protein [Desulfobotulus pelophilus]
MKIILGLILLILLSFPVWRLASRRRSLPCPVWLGWLVEMDNPFTRTNRASTILSLLDIRPGMFVADVGCGPGRLSIPLAQNVGKEGHVIAMDMQEGMLSRTCQKAKASGLDNITFLKAGAGSGALAGYRFDRVLLVTVLGEIPDPKPALAEIYQALKPDGILSVTEIIFDPHFQKKESVLQLASSIGFKEKGFYGNAIAYTLHLEKQPARQQYPSIPHHKDKQWMNSQRKPQ